MNANFLNVIKAFGITAKDVLFFEEANARLTNYLSLINPKTNIPKLTGVIEVASEPFIYLLNENDLSHNPLEKFEQKRQLINVLACRGEKSYLAAISPGSLELSVVRPLRSAEDGLKLSAGTPRARSYIRDLIEGKSNQNLSNPALTKQIDKDSIESILFNLLTSISQDLNSTKKLQGDHETILALCGRALLTRFLIDREILTPQTMPALFKICSGENCFSSAKYASVTNTWLDDTFNGDLLKLPVPREKYASWFSSLDEMVFKKLSLILSKTDVNGQYSLPGFIDFAHVPVGLLSEVYERYAHESHDRKVQASAKKESIHYTPRRIASYMLDEAFEGIITTRAHQAKILDPSCGAGVFVVLAFRRLIAEHWRATNKRPDTKKIREILYGQIRGFDINQSALTLAALGLYLSAIELDPEPLPASKLKFKENLIGTVLHCVRGKDEPWSKTSVVMGSLGPFVPEGSSGVFDIIIGNPPWSSFPSSFNDRLSQCVRDVARKRDSEGLKDVVAHYQNPDQVPDLPFVWKSMEWAKPRGIIVFALHARLLFKNSDLGIKARNHLFNAINITGIVNGSAVRNSRVWPRVTAQFCLLFAINEKPKPNNYFNYISPKYEKYLNDTQGRMRIDFQSSDPIQAKMLELRPHLLNVLYKGTPLDVALIEKIQSYVTVGTAYPLEKYWTDYVGKDRCGVGFQTSSDEQDATPLIAMGARMLSKDADAGYILKTRHLPKFDIPRLHRTRKLGIYETPLVLINKAIGASQSTISARIGLERSPVAYNESFYGYSARGHKSAQSLAKYLFAILNSDLLLYYILMTSSQYGIEREVIHKADVDAFPVIPFEKLSEKVKQQIDNCYENFVATENVQLLNKLIFSVYKIDKYSESIIHDTLNISLPISESRYKAVAEVSDKEISLFIKELKNILLPYIVKIDLCPSPLESWKFFSISSSSGHVNTLENERIFSEIADAAGCSFIKIDYDNSMIVGLLNQYRYWAPSRARLLGAKLIKENFIKTCRD